MTWLSEHWLFVLSLAICAAGVCWLMPQRQTRPRSVGLLLVLAGFVALGGMLQAPAGPLTESVLFWLFGGGAVLCGVLMITSKRPVYSALWFALATLATCGLFLLQSAPFLAAATIIVYAGAIVVTFLFVIMLAQPEGHSDYDRISWGWFPKTFSVLAAATLVALLTFMLGNLRSEAARPLTADVAAATQARLNASDALLSEHHMANLGRHLFAEHLISVELAGTLLLAALVGAVAIAIQGKPRLATRIEEALR
jgi:NADH-quinone oxidoreductase subunit J